MSWMLDGRHVEYVFDEDLDPKADFRQYFHTVQFAKTPKGRRKRLIELTETWDGSEVSEISITILAATAQESSRVIAFLLGQRDLDLAPITVQILQSPYLRNVESFFVRFRDKKDKP